MAVVLKNTPTATEADNAPEGETRLGPGEEAATPEEEHLLQKTMAAVYHSLDAPKKLRTIEAWLLKSKNIGADIGHIAFSILASIFDGAKKAGIQLPVTVFFAQGGAVYQTIDRILLIAEHCGVPNLDQDKIREDALGTLVDAVKQMFGDQMHNEPQGQQPQQPAGPPMLAANPLSHAVNNGLQSQGLLGAQ